MWNYILACQQGFLSHYLLEKSNYFTKCCLQLHLIKVYLLLSYKNYVIILNDAIKFNLIWFSTYINKYHHTCLPKGGKQSTYNIYLSKPVQGSDREERTGGRELREVWFSGLSINTSWHVNLQAKTSIIILLLLLLTTTSNKILA